ncbi:MAG: DHHA1 domain-containing protein, partial [Wenzhouxiangellaceae bacterium]|nr:DHHA1 domain-containing protein [Wenzhouxiangellaceae bacterium]
QKLASAKSSDLAGQAREVAGVRVVAEHLEGVDPNGLRGSVDQLKQQIGSGVIVLSTTAGSGVRLVAGVTDDLTDRLRAGDLVRHVAEQVGGKGGGRADFAQAGGSDIEGIGRALETVEQWVRERA